MSFAGFILGSVCSTFFACDIFLDFGFFVTNFSSEKQNPLFPT